MSSVTRAFQVLDVLAAAGRRGLPFARIVELTDIPKATAHRLLRELTELSVLVYDADTRSYRGGLRLARLGAGIAGDYDLRTVARPHLEAMQAKTGHVVTLGVLSDDEGVYIDKIEPDDFSIRLHSEIGKTFPLHATGMGKVLLAHAPTETVRRIAKRSLPAFTKYTITAAAALRTELAEVRAAGYAIDREEITRGLMCVAAPVFDSGGEIAGALSCTFQSYIDADRGIDREIAEVVSCARAASGL